jgi:hypothetical protein
MMSNRHHPGNVRRLLSTSSGVSPNPTPNRQVNVTRTYLVARSQSNQHNGALIDRGANGGLAGADCCIIAKCPDRFVNIEGIDHHQLPHVPIVTCGAYTVSRNHGPVIVVFHQFAGMQRGPTIILSAQLESFSNIVNDRSHRFDPSGQLITTNDGFKFPLHFRQGLPYLDMRPYTDQEWSTLPHVVMTSNVDWDPAIMDGEFPLTGQEDELDPRLYDSGTNFDVHGRYKQRTLVASARQHHESVLHLLDSTPDLMLPLPGPTDDIPFESYVPCVSDNRQEPPSNLGPPDTRLVASSPHLIKDSLDPESLRKYFAFLPTEVMSQTMASTSQHAQVLSHDTMRWFYKSPFPALNVARRNEDLLTDIVYSDTPAIDNGSTSAAVYSGRASHVLDVFRMMLEDIIRDRGAPTRLLSDHAITSLLTCWTSEPHRQNQNVMEL